MAESRGGGDQKPGAGAPNREREAGVSPAAYAGLGLQFAVAIVAFLYAGQWLDGRLGTSPLFLIVGVFVGAGGGFYSIYRKLMQVQADVERAEREKRERREGRGQ